MLFAMRNIISDLNSRPTWNFVRPTCGRVADTVYFMEVV